MWFPVMAGSPTTIATTTTKTASHSRKEPRPRRLVGRAVLYRTSRYSRLIPTVVSFFR